MEVKGRFTIIDWSPDSPAASPFRHDGALPLGVSSAKPESPRKRLLRKQLSNSSKLSSSATPMASSQSFGAASFASNRHVMGINSAVPPAGTVPTTPRVNLDMFDNHLAFLEKESKDMKSTLESMVNTNAQWIEMLAKSGLNLAAENTPPFRGSDATLSEAVAPVEPVAPAISLASLRRPSFDDKYRSLELAYVRIAVAAVDTLCGCQELTVCGCSLVNVVLSQLELQKKYENALRDNERMEIKNIMLETRLQQQVTRAENLRAQLEKLTRYTENLIGDYSEANYNGYASDLNSLFGGQSSVEVDEQSPTAVEMSSEYDFNYEALKDQDHSASMRQRRRSDEEECISDTSSEQDLSSGCEFPDNNQPFSRSFSFDDGSRRPAGLTTADLSSLSAVMVDPAALLGESKTNTSTSSDDDMMPSPDDNQRTHEFPERSLTKLGMLKRQGSSFASMNMSTVSSTSSLASFGAQVAALNRSKDGSLTDLLAAAMANQRQELAIDPDTLHKSSE